MVYVVAEKEGLIYPDEEHLIFVYLRREFQEQ